jgi:hypothetical protein
VRALVVADVLAGAGCTFNGRGPDPVIVRPKPDPDRMPSAVLDHQDPGADTSHNPELSRSGSRHGIDAQWLGCLRWVACDAGARGGGDASGVLLVLALVAATRKRNRS